MTQNDANQTMQDPTWQLLTEFSLPKEPGHEEQAAFRVMRAIGELSLQPAQVERIRGAIVQAVRNGMRPRTQMRYPPTVSVRVWTSAADAGDAHSSGDEGPQNRRPVPGGWGSFLIQKRVHDPQASAEESVSFIELFLYQERDHHRDQNK